MSGALTIAQALQWGGVVLFCPACRVLVNVLQATKQPFPIDTLNDERCPRCWKAFLDVVEPKV